MFDARSGATDPVAMVSTHRHPVAVMRYNEVHNTVISVDAKGGLCNHWWFNCSFCQRSEIVVRGRCAHTLYLLHSRIALWCTARNRRNSNESGSVHMEGVHMELCST